MKILVRGAGLAGLSAARALAEFAPRGALSVTVRESQPDRLRACDVGLGLWPAAQRALDRLGAPGRRLRHRGCSVPPAAYRDRNGVWLSQSSRRDVRVQTICENDLRSFLYEESRANNDDDDFGNACDATGSLPFRWSDRGVTFIYGDSGGNGPLTRNQGDSSYLDDSSYDLVMTRPAVVVVGQIAHRIASVASLLQQTRRLIVLKWKHCGPSGLFQAPRRSRHSSAHLFVWL